LNENDWNVCCVWCLTYDVILMWECDEWIVLGMWCDEIIDCVIEWGMKNEFEMNAWLLNVMWLCCDWMNVLFCVFCFFCFELILLLWLCEWIDGIWWFWNDWMVWWYELMMDENVLIVLCDLEKWGIGGGGGGGNDVDMLKIEIMNMWFLNLIEIENRKSQEGGQLGGRTWGEKRRIKIFLEGKKKKKPDILMDVLWLWWWIEIECVVCDLCVVWMRGDMNILVNCGELMKPGDRGKMKWCDDWCFFFFFSFFLFVDGVWVRLIEWCCREYLNWNEWCVVWIWWMFLMFDLWSGLILIWWECWVCDVDENVDWMKWMMKGSWWLKPESIELPEGMERGKTEWGILRLELKQKNYFRRRQGNGGKQEGRKKRIRRESNWKKKGQENKGEGGEGISQGILGKGAKEELEGEQKKKGGKEKRRKGKGGNFFREEDEIKRRNLGRKNFFREIIFGRGEWRGKKELGKQKNRELERWLNETRSGEIHSLY